MRGLPFDCRADTRLHKAHPRTTSSRPGAVEIRPTRDPCQVDHNAQADCICFDGHAASYRQSSVVVFVARDSSQATPYAWLRASRNTDFLRRPRRVGTGRRSVVLHLLAIPAWTYSGRSLLGL